MEEEEAASDFDELDFGPTVDEPPWPLAALRQTLDVSDRVLGRFPGVGSVVEAAASVRAIVEFFDDISRQRTVPPVAPASTSPILRDLKSALRSIRVVLLAAEERGGVSDELGTQLREASAEAERRTIEFLGEFARGLERFSDDIRRDAGPVVERHTELFDARRLAAETRSARDAAVDALDSTLRAAGRTGEEQLGLHFSVFAEAERKSANRLRLAVVLMVVLAAGIAALVVLRPAHSRDPWDQELAKLALTLPLLGLATYFARESKEHRAGARWASELEVQLRTVDAYSESLSPEGRERLRAELGRRVFTSRATRRPTADRPCRSPSCPG